MKILVSTRAFLPLIGGLELGTAQLAEELTRLGHEVVVLTTTPGDVTGLADRFPFRVIRRPGWRETLRWMRWCDVVHQPNLSLRGSWPWLLVRRPWVVSHHSWYRRPDGRIAWQDRLKRRLLRCAAGSIAVSRAMADDLQPPPTVIGNPYQDRLFRCLSNAEPAERTGELAFVGRLVSDKGVDLLVDALDLLAREGLRPGLTIIGEGPERQGLEERVRVLGLAGQVRFLGLRTGEELVRLLNEHRILVVPSRYREPFGTVALEGIACGCAVVGSAEGGLADAIGACGRTFPNGDTAALARTLSELLRDPGAREALLRHAPEHLMRHTGESVAHRYLEVFQAALGGSRR
jgi:glycosyltransferase involved in cell wall biosynthesis